MPPLREELAHFVEPALRECHRRILEKLQDLKLDDIVARKTPYLFRVKSPAAPRDWAKLVAFGSAREVGEW